MAKRQHGKSFRDRTTDSEKMTEHFDLGLNSSDDEAPDEVTFEDSKASAIKRMKNALETARREKDLLKEKRRRRQELFQEQKKKRLLPADVLEEIDIAQPKKQNLSIDQEKENSDIETGGSEEGEGKEEKETDKNQDDGVRGLKGNNSVMRLKGRPSANFQQQAAVDFIQSRLYGAQSHRTTNNELLSLANKRGQNKCAAVQFVKKDWATKKKEKAEKFKKRWIHKKNASSN
ncbi:nucleolar protein 7 [Hypomesus transpacificus]|uniref:nucleolar protein 7 n=1 Tax=Hypomesus transpacificus TaxID=137520 RepID=UPI001F0725F8|nr:nucleolar protein 7 [Hypomesus transpacificus]